MDLVFNDLSTRPLAKDIPEAGKRLHQYFTVVKELKESGFKRVRYIDTFEKIMLTPEHSFLSFCQLRESPSLMTKANTLLSLTRHPFIDDDSEEETRYIQNKFYITKDDQQLEAPALGTAYLYNTIAVNLESEEYWTQLEYNLAIKGEEEQVASILAVCSVSHCREAKFTSWKENNTPTPAELIKTPLNPDKKKIHFRDDHGTDVLDAFAKRIRKSPYVSEIINSLPFNSYERDFIRKVKPNGLIEIVLTHTDKGLGMVIQTTGRNLKETTLIADILREGYAE